MNENCEACLSRRRVYGVGGCSLCGTYCLEAEE